MRLASIPDDAVCAVHRIRRHPGRYVLLALTLAFGIGSVLGVFDLGYGALYGGLPYRDPQHIAVADDTFAGLLYNTETFQPRPLSATIFSTAALYHVQSADLALGPAPQRIQVAAVTPDFFATLGVSMILGRDVAAEEQPLKPSPHPAMGVVISHRLWRAHFSHADAVLGTRLPIDGLPGPFYVTGVAPPDVAFPAGVDAWIPEHRQSVSVIQEAGVMPLWRGVIGRLAPGVSIEAADATIRRGHDNTAVSAPAPMNSGRLILLRQSLQGEVYRLGPALWIETALFLMFSIAVAMSIARTEAAERVDEMALRRMLGATPGGLLRLLALETVMLIGAASLGALVVRRCIVDVTITHLSLPSPAHANAGALTLALLVAAVSVVSLGILASHVRGIGRHRFPVHVIPATVIAVAAASLLTSACDVILLDSGVLDRDAFVCEIGLNGPADEPRDVWRGRVTSAVDAIEQRLRKVPGVRHAAVISVSPYSGYQTVSSSAYYSRDDSQPSAADVITGALARSMSSQTIGALGLRLIDGRNFDDADRGVVIVNQSLAARLGPERRAVGQYLRFIHRGFPPHRIVGVVNNVHETDLLAPVKPTLYFSFNERPTASFNLVIRLARTVARRDLLEAVEASVRSVAPRATVSQFASLSDRVRDVGRSRRYVAAVLLAFSSIAAILAGICAAAASWSEVSRREPEIAVRLALGATTGRLVWQFAWSQLSSIIAGALAGACVAFWIAHVVGLFLMGTGPGGVMPFAAGVSAVVASSGLMLTSAAVRAVRRVPARMLASRGVG